MASQNQDISITNTHGDHVASCLCCQKFSGSTGSAGYSELTPGYPGSIDCNAGEFSYGSDDSFSEILSVLHDTARHCKLFVPRKVKRANTACT